MVERLDRNNRSSELFFGFVVVVDVVVVVSEVNEPIENQQAGDVDRFSASTSRHGN